MQVTCVTSELTMIGSSKGKGFSYRLKNEHAGLVADLMAAVGLKKSAILDIALAEKLPALEIEYATQLARLRAAREVNSANTADTSTGNQKKGTEAYQHLLDARLAKSSSNKPLKRRGASAVKPHRK